MGARDDAAVYTSMMWGTAAPLVGCLRVAQQKACRCPEDKPGEESTSSTFTRMTQQHHHEST